jgi:hypothetical protein
MKKILYSFLVCLLFIFTSCEKDTQDTSKITYYVTYDIKGGKTFLVPVGTSYVEPGVIAMEGDKDVTSSMKTTGTVDANKIGVYPVTYSAVNVDGFASSDIRTVVVYDPAIKTDISGKYTVAGSTYRFRGGTKVPFSGYPVDVEKIAPGVFAISDFLGGYYDKRAAYGSSYAMAGYISLKLDNTLEVLSSKMAGWGDSLNSFNNGSFNPSTNSIHWEAAYSSGPEMTFFVDLNK